ncbi:MAG: rhodanese-like domain-containing protein [Pseudolabrys sp.]
MSLLGFLKHSTANGAPALAAIDAATARQWHAGKEYRFIDIREDAEFGAEHITGAQLAPLSRLEQALPGDRKGAKAVFYCLSGMRTKTNAARLAGLGFGEAYLLEGGLRAWKAEGAPTEH